MGVRLAKTVLGPKQADISKIILGCLYHSFLKKSSNMENSLFY